MRFNLISESDFAAFKKALQTQAPISYDTLKGKGSQGKSRKDAICTGIIQAAINAQQTRLYTDKNGKTAEFKKPFSDDWTSEGYLRWAISCGFIEYLPQSDSCQITDFGVKLANSQDGSDDEKEILTTALLSYPPLIRILSLLKERDDWTKFELGEMLGFKGERGFTSFPQAMYLCDLTKASDKGKVRSNCEGDSDKYARGIASWCEQMGWVSSANKKICGTYRGTKYCSKMQAYSVTRAGEKALLRALGNFSNPRPPKIVPFEMLASNKAAGADYLRYQRAAILKELGKSPKTLATLKTALNAYELDTDEAAIKDHIAGLNFIGVEISESSGKYKLKDKIERLNLPARIICAKNEINDIADRVRSKLKHLDHKYLALIDLAHSSAKRALTLGNLRFKPPSFSQRS